MNPIAFQNAIISWQRVSGRQNLPWQINPTPYRVWVSEIMLQQTQVKTVIPYYEKFMQRFPDEYALANASQDEVLGLWTGLGYYSRARNLHKAAQLAIAQHGQFPTDFEAVLALPGIGRSTAGAVVSLSLNQPYPICDGNVRRVFARFFGIEGWPGTTANQKQLWQLAEAYLAEDNAKSYNQGLMDLGANICTRSRPGCAGCPVQEGCFAFKEGLQAELPEAKPKKIKPVKATTFFMWVNEMQEVWLEQRPETGIWAKLWSFPEKTDSRILSANQRTLATFRHTFTHYHLDVTPVMIKTSKQAMAEQAGVWYTFAETQRLGLPQPVKRLLERIHHENDFL